MADETGGLLAQLSEQMADAVASNDTALVTVDARRRHPASGVVIGDGLVLTADHVVEREEEIGIGTHDGRSLQGELAGRDPSSDLALLRVGDLGLAAAAESDATARVGQLALAVGRPFDEPMASLGVVSSVGGPVRTRRGGMLEQYIRTDAIPYPGFSGGMLVGASGELLGILTTGLIGGVTLAIPGGVARSVAASLEQHGSVKRGYLGISTQPVKIPEAQRGGREQKRGLLIMRVEPGSAAESSGLLVGDIMLAFDGVAVRDGGELQALLLGGRAGTTVPVELVRGGTIETIQVTVGER